ncbi:sugar-binding protein [Ructibacterium gallinarum]|uniref:Carbohydrate-binding domain-containing protein n=1 Tax=Ructibacterium gallinarum TaxID=2779355 RepID=A0A9D5LZV8_9FIRM|nr:sugar-binding protein [Ructibacterium gallinarum]MBE5039576.1 hypothetical protein [Ructibacterium gallinarum]
MSIYKKMVLFTLSFILIFPSNMLVSFSAAEGANESLSGYTVLWDEDFDNVRSVSSCVDYSELDVSIAEYDAEHGSSLKMVMDDTNSKYPKIRKDFGQAFSSGTLYLGYDILRTASGRTEDAFGATPQSSWGNGLFMASTWPGGTTSLFSYYENCHIDAIKQPWPSGASPQLNEWHHIDTWWDLDNRIAYYFIDGVEVGHTTITNECTEISSYGRNGNGSYGTGIEYLDNYKLIHLSEIGKEIVIDGIQGIPDYIESPVMLSLTTDELGNNFFTEEGEVNVQINGITKDAVQGSLSLSIADEYGNVILHEDRDIAIDSNESKTETFVFGFKRYGYYYVTSDFTANGYNPASTETTLVYLRKSEEQNQRLGYSSHSTWNFGTDEIERKLDLFAKTGFKYQRESVYWSYFEQNGGESYEFNELDQRIQDALNNSDIEMFQLMGGVEAAIGKDLPETEEEFRRFDGYVYNLALALKDTVQYYEIFNEMNLSSEEDGAERYVAAQKVAYEAIKRADPDSIVLCGATARVPLDWIEMLLKAGAGNYFDEFSCHPYTVENVPETGRVMQGEGTAEDMVISLRNLLDQYGLQNKKITISELSYSSGAGYASERQQAAFGLRQYIFTQKHVDLFIWYNDQEKGTDTSLENNFGLITNWGDSGVPYQAKPVLLAFSTFNSLLANAENLGKIDTENEDIWIYQFKRADEKDVLAVWNMNDTNQSIALDLGTDSAELVDMYGNSRTIYAYNGKLNFDICGDVTYLVGNFSQVDLCEAEFSAYQYETDVIKAEDFDLRLTLPADDKIKIEAACSDNTSVKEISGDTIRFSSGVNNQDEEKIVINVQFNGRLAYTHNVELNYIEPLSYTYSIIPYNQQRYQGVLKVTNRRSSNVSMQLTLDSPESLAGKTYNIDTLVPGNERTIKINIPIEDADINRLDISGTITIEGEEVNDSMAVTLSKEFGCLKYGDKKPVIDGKLDDGEWHEFLPIKIDQKSMAQKKEWKGVDDLSGTIYTMCDDEYFYLAADVKDDIYYDETEPSTVWAVDSIQFAIAVSNKFGAASTEIGLGIANGEATLQSFISQMIGGEQAADTFTFSDDTLYAVKRYEEEKRTVYELQLPWDQIYAKPINISHMKSIYFSVLINDHDNNSAGRGWLEYCGGIGSSKNPELFMELPVYKVQ